MIEPLPVFGRKLYVGMKSGGRSPQRYDDLVREAEREPHLRFYADAADDPCCESQEEEADNGDEELCPQFSSADDRTAKEVQE